MLLVEYECTLNHSESKFVVAKTVLKISDTETVMTIRMLVLLLLIIIKTVIHTL